MINKYSWNTICGSVLAHVAFALGLIFLSLRTPVAPLPMAPVKFHIAYTPKPLPKVIEHKPAEVKPKPLPKVVKKMITPPKSERKPTTTPTPDAAPVQGLAVTSLSPGGHGIAVPVGNTLMREDEGKRLKPTEVKELEQDLSAEASLIRESFVKPPYSQEALFAQLQGTFAVLVFVDKQGNATDVELPRKIGYEMDEPIKKAVLTAKYYPKKDKSGEPLEGWTEIKIRLEIP